MRLRILTSTLLLSFALAVKAVSAAGDYVLLVHPPSGETIEKASAMALIKGERRNWEGGIDALVLLPARDSVHYEPIAKRLFGLSGKGMERQWFRLVFSGQVNPPVYLDSDSAVVEYVAAHPGSIGVADASTVPASSEFLVIPF